jgi:hypothetical protein
MDMSMWRGMMMSRVARIYNIQHGREHVEGDDDVQVDRIYNMFITLYFSDFQGRNTGRT